MPDTTTTTNGSGANGASRAGSSTNGSGNGSPARGVLAHLRRPNGYPCLRADLQVFTSAAKGNYLLRDPLSGEATELGEQEFFLCGQLDGHTAPADVLARFERRFRQTMDPGAFDALIRQLVRQRILVTAQTASAPAVAIEPPPVAVWSTPSWIDVDAVFTTLARAFAWCFTRAFAVAAGAVILLGTAVVARHWSVFTREAQVLLKGDFPVLMSIAVLLGVTFYQAVATGVACKIAGARVRVFELRLFYYLIPYFHTDFDDMKLQWKKRARYRMLAVGYASELLAMAVAAILWVSTPEPAPLRTFWLVLTWALIAVFPWNPLIPRRTYLLLSEWLEVPDMAGRGRLAVWNWIFGLPEREPLTRKERIGLRTFGALWYLYFAALLGFGAYLAVPAVVAHIDVTGFALVLVVALFAFEFPLRKELGRFEPLGPWFAKNEGKSTVAWLTRISLAALLVLAMLLPYPYEPGGDLRILPSSRQGIRARVQAKVAEVLVDEGDWVKKGQIVARLDPREQEKNLAVAEAGLASAKSQLKLMQLGGKPEEVAKAREQMGTAEKALFYSRREAERLRQLYAQRVVSLQLYERALQNRDVDQQVYDTAKQNLALVMSGARPDAIDAAQAEVDHQAALVKKASDDLAFTVIHSPANGRVVTPRAKERVGQEVIVGDLLLGIEDSRTLRAEVAVPEQTTGKIKPGARVKVKAWTYPNRTFIGTVASVAPVITDKKKEGKIDYLSTEREDALSRATTSDPGRIVRVLVSLPNPDGLLKSEMTGYAKIRTHTEPLGLVLTHGLVRFFLVEVWSWIP